MEWIGGGGTATNPGEKVMRGSRKEGESKKE